MRPAEAASASHDARRGDAHGMGVGRPPLAPLMTEGNAPALAFGVQAGPLHAVELARALVTLHSTADRLAESDPCAALEPRELCVPAPSFAQPALPPPSLLSHPYREGQDEPEIARARTSGVLGRTLMALTGGDADLGRGAGESLREDSSGLAESSSMRLEQEHRQLHEQASLCRATGRLSHTVSAPRPSKRPPFPAVSQVLIGTFLDQFKRRHKELPAVRRVQVASAASRLYLSGISAVSRPRSSRRPLRQRR